MIFSWSTMFADANYSISVPDKRGQLVPSSQIPMKDLQPLIQAALAAVTDRPRVVTPLDASITSATISAKQQQVDAEKRINAQPRPRQLPSSPRQQIVTVTSDINDEQVIRLDYTSINDEILRKNTANFVYFNANFNRCRNCNKFYNIWNELALDIRWWRQVIKLFSINCSDDDNIDVCRRAGVTQFPQVRFYWIMSQSLDQDGQRMRILGKSVHAMRHLIMDKVLESYTEHKSLVQRVQQQRNGIGTGVPNPLQAVLPMLTQLLSPSANGSSAGGLSGLMNMFLSGGLPTGSHTKPSQQTQLAGQIPAGLGSFQGITDIINILSGMASWRKGLTIQPIPNNWPDFEQIDVDGDAKRLMDSLPLDVRKGVGALLIMETQEFLYTGLETMLDLSPYSDTTYLARVRDERSQLTRNLTRRDDVQAPALIYITDKREARLLLTAPKFTDDEDLRRAFVRTFERRQVKYPVKRTWARVAQQTDVQVSTGDSQEDEEIISRVHQIYMSDLMLTIRASLMEQVFRHPDLSDDQYNALVKYVYTLINYFPFADDGSLKFFKRLHTWLQNQVSPIDIGEYKKQFHDVDDMFGKPSEWMSCKSLSNTKAIPTKGRKSVAAMLFENPSRLGKVVSNITRLLRTNQQKAGQLKSLIGMFTSNFAPILPPTSDNSGSVAQKSNSSEANSTSTAKHVNGVQREGRPSQISSKSANSSQDANERSNKEESPIQRLFTGLTNGSLGSDSSILRLISTALTGGGSRNDTSSGKSKFAREYPCGAWKLAHVMVVNEYIKDSPRKDVKHIVLHSLYQYMLQFFACATCGNRVSDVSGEFRLNLEDHLREQGDSVLLLWKIHNRVNKRLESEVRPGSPNKQQFPNEILCPKCRSPRNQNDLITTPNWHEKQVLTFLVHHYRPQSIMKLDQGSSSSNSASLSISSTLVMLLMLSTLFLGRSW